EATARLSLESELRRAIDQGDLELYYQPQILLRTAEVIGSEALLRWNRAGEGFVQPAQFVPLAEETGLIVEIGRWVLREACRSAAQWNAGGGACHRVSINLSARQFQSRDLALLVKDILAETGCRPEWLEFEITESLLLEEDDSVMSALLAFESMGLSIAIDDFGTGYSALSYLTRFPIDTLKIDRTFVQQVTTDRRHAELVKAILSIARCLGQRVVAEGVETMEQAAFLEAHGCEVAQGFLYSKPLAKSDIASFPRYLGAGTPDARTAI
ncbi:MAG: EAL domain-containing protein, partial [Paraburkholderia sp.]|nr:EAL domain-containing protein [Paraburkholderia sp.]